MLIIKLVDNKIDEIDKHITDRQSRERNVIIFRIEEPNTNLIKERQAKDLETLNGNDEIANSCGI